MSSRRLGHLGKSLEVCVLLKAWFSNMNGTLLKDFMAWPQESRMGETEPLNDVFGIESLKPKF